MRTSLKMLPIVACMSLAFSAQAEQLAYSKQLIKSILPPGQDVDTSYLDRGLDMAPGIYNLELEVNGKPYHSRNVELREYNGRLEPVFKFKDLQGLPIKEKALANLGKISSETEIFPISKYFNQLTASIDVETQRVILSIPQIYFDEENEWFDIAPQELWDSGINAGVINYGFTGNHNKFRGGGGGSYTTLSGAISGQLNLGDYRLHTSGSVNYARSSYDGISDSDHEYDLWNTYIERDVNAVQGTLQVGEISTNGTIFNSIPMRGIRLTTNEMMLPIADRNYAPVIEGLANTNAQILIRQNGHVVYTTNVAAGPFKLDKLPSFGSDGDLEVVIREADGTERLMIVPYSSIPVMLKAGQYRYDVNIGQYFKRNQIVEYDKKIFTMATLAYGLDNGVTFYGGGLLSEKYIGSALGVGLSLGRYGALSLDATQSKASRDPSNSIWEDLSGTAWRIRYEKTMLATGTTINLANYHYLTGNYRTFNEINDNKSYQELPISTGSLKSNWQLSLSQSLGSVGSLYGGLTYTTYKGTDQDSKTINIGYNTMVKGVGISLNYGRNYEKRYQKGWMSSQTVMLNLNIPLSLFFSTSDYSSLNRMNAQYQGSMFTSESGTKTYQQRAVINGYSEDHLTNWSVSQAGGAKNDRESSVRVGYDSPYFGSDFSYTYSNNAHNYQLGLNGALIMHSGGLTPSRYALDSIALVEVPNTPGVRLNSYMDTKTDIFGYATLTNLANYMRNEISIDPASLPEGALLLDNSNRIIYPTKGAIVKVQFPVRFGRQALFYLSSDGENLPFGAHVSLLQNNNEEDLFVRGIVGQKGRVFLTALPTSGILKATYGNVVKFFEFDLPDTSINNDNDFKPVPQIYLNSSGNKENINGLNYIPIVRDEALQAQMVRRISTNKAYFKIKDRFGNIIPKGTIVKYENQNIKSEARVGNDGFVFISNLQSSGEFFVGDQRYVY